MGGGLLLLKTGLLLLEILVSDKGGLLLNIGEVDLFPEVIVGSKGLPFCGDLVNGGEALPLLAGVLDSGGEK